ncbi:carboxypeptidase regulatory-like domain-containing protein, partial [bacterium]|nr:carboxypeptidase regulatory-like domain-containing protein [bacterium]
MNKKLIGLVIVSILGFLFLNLTCEPPSEAETTGTINGTILDAITFQPVSGAVITTIPISSTKTSDSEGTYQIEGVEPGTYSVQASKNGYITNSTTVKIIAGEETSADIQLSPQGVELSVSTTSLNFGIITTNLTLSITNSGVGNLTWNIISTSNWITVYPTSGSTETETDVITVKVNRSGMDCGNHYETITIASNANSKTIEVLMTIPNPNEPQLSAYPFTLDFGTDKNEMNFNISNTGDSTVHWYLSTESDWISFNPDSGSTEKEVDVVKVNINRNGFEPGSYSGIITISSNGGNQNISIVFTVPDKPFLSVSPKILDFGNDKDELSFNIINGGTGELIWSVSDNKEWITFYPESGTNEGTINIT